MPRRLPYGWLAGAGGRALASGPPWSTSCRLTIQRTRRLLEQARTRLAGGMPAGSSRLVSLHDPDARPIRKGRIGHSVQFGYKVQVVDTPDGIVLDHTSTPLYRSDLQK